MAEEEKILSQTQAGSEGLPEVSLSPPDFEVPGFEPALTASPEASIPLPPPKSEYVAHPPPPAA